MEGDDENVVDYYDDDDDAHYQLADSLPPPHLHLDQSEEIAHYVTPRHNPSLHAEYDPAGIVLQLRHRSRSAPHVLRLEH